jgi:hypothetical protein
VATGKKVASEAAKELRNASTPKRQKAVDASALAQRKAPKARKIPRKREK